MVMTVWKEFKGPHFPFAVGTTSSLGLGCWRTELLKVKQIHEFVLSKPRPQLFLISPFQLFFLSQMYSFLTHLSGLCFTISADLLGSIPELNLLHPRPNRPSQEGAAFHIHHDLPAQTQTHQPEGLSLSAWLLSHRQKGTLRMCTYPATVPNPSSPSEPTVCNLARAQLSLLKPDF